MHLLQTGNFTLNSGAKSTWKLELDYFSQEDWQGAAEMLRYLLPAYSEVRGIPRGGLILAECLSKFATNTHGPILIVDDVLTTGNSMEKMRSELVSIGKSGMIGAVVFARGPCPPWIRCLFQMPPELWVVPEGSPKRLQARVMQRLERVLFDN